MGEGETGSDPEDAPDSSSDSPTDEAPTDDESGQDGATGPDESSLPVDPEERNPPGPPPWIDESEDWSPNESAGPPRDNSEDRPAESPRGPPGEPPGEPASPPGAHPDPDEAPTVDPDSPGPPSAYEPVDLDAEHGAIDPETFPESAPDRPGNRSLGPSGSPPLRPVGERTPRHRPDRRPTGEPGPIPRRIERDDDRTGSAPVSGPGPSEHDRPSELSVDARIERERGPGDRPGLPDPVDDPASEFDVDTPEDPEYDLQEGDTPVEEFSPPGLPEEEFEGAAEGAPDDQEMPLADHIEEMVRRLGVVVLATAIVSAIVFPFAEYIISYLWFSFLPGTAANCPTMTSGMACPRVYHPLALMLARLKVSTLAGFVVALPVAVYQAYRFMRPGLYPRERRYYLAAVPTSLVLAAVGMLFANFLVLPLLFTYFHYYTEGAAEIWFGLSHTFDLIVMMLGLFALTFQIPLLVMLAIMMGITSRDWLASKRLYFWGGFLGISFLFNPDLTGMAPFLVAGTMIALFEGTLLLVKWTKRGSDATSDAPDVGV